MLFVVPHLVLEGLARKTVGKVEVVADLGDEANIGVIHKFLSCQQICGKSHVFAFWTPAVDRDTGFFSSIIYRVFSFRCIHIILVIFEEITEKVIFVGCACLEGL